MMTSSRGPMPIAVRPAVSAKVPLAEETEMANAEIGRVLLLKGRALVLWPYRNSLRSDDPGDRFDLLLADNIHWR